MPFRSALKVPNAQLCFTRSIMSSSNARPRQSTVADHLAGSKDAWHGKITPDGPFKPEKDRYYLYIGLFCPFAHRVNLVRHLKKLQTIIPLVVVRPYPKGDNTGWPGWKFPESIDEYAGATPDPLHPSKYLHELYFKADPEYQGRYSVPVLWDSKTSTIVNNESTELLRDLTHCFDSLIPNDDHDTTNLDFYPLQLQPQIDTITTWMQQNLNTGVYKAGFSTDQSSYDTHILPVFASLNLLEKIIHSHGGPFALGQHLTEVDLRLYPTIIRFDTVYVQHFKCNLGTIRHDYPVLNNWMIGLYHGLARMSDGRQIYGFGDVDLESLRRDNGGKDERGTVDFTHIKENYTKSHTDVNPTGITPRGPWPNVEGAEGYESDFSRVKVGGCLMPEVVELAEKLERFGKLD